MHMLEEERGHHSIFEKKYNFDIANF